MKSAVLGCWAVFAVSALLCAALATTALGQGAARGAAASALEIRGVVVPPARWPLPGKGIVNVVLHAVGRPFSASTTAFNGRFRFRKVTPGLYTLAVAVAGFQEHHQTIDVSPSFADRRGRIVVKVPLEAPANREAEGITVSTRALSIPAGAWSEYNHARNELRSADKVQSAVNRLNRLVEHEPKFVEAFNLLGTIHYQRHELEQAEACFRKALDADGGAFEPMVNLGGTLLDLGQYDEALNFNMLAVKTRPDDALANAQAGINYYRLGDMDAAIRYLTHAKQIDPSHFSYPQAYLAEIYLHLGENAKAAAELEEFQRLHPDHPMSARIAKRLPEIRKGQSR